MDYQQLLTLTDKILILRGSAGSGNFGHDGRPGKHGGSQSGGGLRRIGAKKDTPAGDRKKAAKKFREKRNEVKKETKKIDAKKIIANSQISKLGIKDTDKSLDGKKTFSDIKAAVTRAINVINEALPKMKAAGVDMKKAAGDTEGLFRNIVRKGWGSSEVEFSIIHKGRKAITAVTPRHLDDIVVKVTNHVSNFGKVTKALTLRGGAGSGNWGHVGRKGKRGGSGKGGGLGAIGVKPGSSRGERKEAAKKLKGKRKDVAAVKRLIQGDARGLEDISRDELLTLRGRIDQLLGGSKDANDQLKRETPEIKHGHTVTVLGTDPSKKFEMRYEVRELDDLITSNNDSGTINPNFPKDLQPRDRTRVASQRQIDNIASNLQPEALLDEFKAIDRGTPIIGGDNAVESGNGRTMALRRARDQHPEQYAKYQDQLKKSAQDKGIDPGTLDQFQNPVLVRKRVTDVDRVEFAKEANTASILGASDTERARSDAGRISSEHLQNIDIRGDIEGTLRAPSNRPFVRSFVANTPEVERATMVDRNGKLTASGEKRIKAAMFNRVYDSPELSDRIFEATDNDVKNVTNGLMNSLGPMSRAEELVRTGQRGKGLSISDDVTKTVRVYATLKERKLSVNDFLAQGALFGRELNPAQEKILVEIDKRRRSGKQLSEFFQGWSDLVEREPHPGQGSLFGGGGGRSKDALIDDWIKRANQGPQPGFAFQSDIPDLLDLAQDIIILRGGPTSGNWAHLGRKGKRGGSKGGGGHKAAGVAPGASRKEIVSSSKQERQARGAGVVKIDPEKVTAARAAVGNAKITRDKGLELARKAEMSLEKPRKEAVKAQNKYFKSIDAVSKLHKASQDAREKADRKGDEIMRFANSGADFLDPKVKAKAAKLREQSARLNDRSNLARDKFLAAVKTNDKNRDESDKAAAVFKKAEADAAKVKKRGQVIADYQKETEGASKVLFQHNLNEAKTARAEIKNAERVRIRDEKRLVAQQEKQTKVIDKAFDRMNKANYPDNDPRAAALIDASLAESVKLGEINKKLMANRGKETAQIREHLHVDNPTKIKTAPGSQRAKSDIQKNEWEQGRKGFENLVSDDTLPRGTGTRFKHTEDNRSFHRAGRSVIGGQEVSEVHMSSMAGGPIMAHELGHMAEANNPRMLKRSIEWRDGRTKGEKFKPLADITGNQGYDADEKSKADKFLDAYIGKDYGSRASEVFSMGIERMYRDPLGFAEKDPDMFDFIYAQARTP